MTFKTKSNICSGYAHRPDTNKTQDRFPQHRLVPRDIIRLIL